LVLRRQKLLKDVVFQWLQVWDQPTETQTQVAWAVYVGPGLNGIHMQGVLHIDSGSFLSAANEHVVRSRRVRNSSHGD
jgi:hypothetical protein